MESARLKSWSRRIASRSMRTWATTVVANILSQFVPGLWHNIPADMTDGAKEAYQLAIKIYGCPVKPIGQRFLINHNGSGGCRIAGKQTSKNPNRLGKISNSALLRDIRKTSSKWVEAEKKDSKFKGVGIELKKIGCAAGLVGTDVHIIKNMPPDRMSSNILILKLKGMGACQDMKARSDSIAYVVFLKSQGRDERTGETTCVLFAKWYYETIVHPFIEEFRTTHPRFKWKKGTPVPIDLRAVLKFDSEMSYTGLLKKVDVASKDENLNILHYKIAGGYTECSQAWDKSTVFKDQNRLNKILTDVDNDEIQLKIELKNQFNKLHAEKKLILTKSMREAIIDYLCISREVGRLSNSCYSVKMGFVMAGDISKSVDGNKFYPCPDIDVMINANRNVNLKMDSKKYKKMLLSVGKKMKEDGHVFESWFDNQTKDYFPKDTLEDGKTVIKKKCADSAYHEQRAMLMNWPSMVRSLKKLEESKLKILQAKQKRREILCAQFALNKEAENILRNLAGLSENSSLASVAESHFENSKLKLDHLRAFVWLRTTNDIAADDSSKPKMNRGSYRDIENGNTGPFMFQEAYNVRNNTASTKLLEDQIQDNFEATLPVCVQVNGNADQQRN